jgi:hypothetical protein
MDWAEIFVAVGTWVIAGATIWLVKGQLSIAKEQRKIQLFLELRKEFDDLLITARKLLARQLLDGTPHEEINEPVMNFFEDMGMLVRRDYVHREMIWDTFSYYAIRWWSGCKDYIAKERADKGDDTLFRDYEGVVETIYKDEIRKRHKTRTELEPTSVEIRRFLGEEAAL